MTQHYEHTHCHQHEGTCSCNFCAQKSHPRDIEGSCCCAEKFLELADEAWKEVLIEKIKEKILARKGEYIDKLTELIAKSNGEKWNHRIKARLQCDEYKDKLKEFFFSGNE